jgi:hypothetical protein
MGWLQRNPLIAALCVLAVILAAIIALEMGLGPSLASALQPGGAKRSVAADSKLLPAIVATAPEQAYPETAARPLFIPTRRPAPEAVVAPQSTFQKGQFVLQGVIAVGENRIAMLREKSNGKIHRVERGKEVNGIKVAEIQRETVTLAQGGEQEVLALAVQRPTGAVAPQQGGPFAGMPNPGGAPQAAPAPGGQPNQALPAPGMPFGAAAAGRTAATPGAGPLGGPAPAANAPANPAARAPESDGSPMSPEELLARRRARRTQTNQ